MLVILVKKINPKIFLSLSVYLGWFGCVYFAKADWQLASLVFPVVSWLILESVFKLTRPMRLQLLIFLIVGILFDSVSAYYNLIEMTPPGTNGILPLWLISLWLVFVASIPLLQSVLKKRYFLAVLLGGVFGPLSYRAGAQFDILVMKGTLATIIYSLFWALYIPSAIFCFGRKVGENENS